MKKVVIALLAIVSIVTAQNKPVNTMKTYGYVKAWYKNSTEQNQQEFTVRMARFGLKGAVNEYSGYKVFVDFARLGKMKTSTENVNGVDVVTGTSVKFSDVLLDAVATLKPVKNLSFSLGQFKIPFSTENLKSGASIDFINRSLITKVTPSLRDIGFMSSYTFENIPFDLSMGLFNGSGQNNSENDKTINYSVRGVFEPIENAVLSANYYEGRLSGLNVKVIDFGAEFNFYNLNLSGEFAQRQTDSPNYDNKSSAYYSSLIYNIAVKNDFLKGIMPAIRYEFYDADNELSDNEIDRISFGVALQFAERYFSQLKFNYESYSEIENSNNFTIEYQVKF